MSLGVVTAETLANTERRLVTACATHDGGEVLFPLLLLAADPAVAPGRSLFKKVCPSEPF